MIYMVTRPDYFCPHHRQSTLSLTVYIAKVVKILRHKQMLLSFLLCFSLFFFIKRSRSFFRNNIFLKPGFLTPLGNSPDLT